MATTYIEEKKIRSIIRTFTWSLPVVLIVWITNKNIPLFGSLTLECTSRGCNSGLIRVVTQSTESDVSLKNRPVVEVSLIRPMRDAIVSVEYAKPMTPQHVAVETTYPEQNVVQTDKLGSFIPSTFYSNWSWQSQHGLVLLTRRTTTSVRTYGSVEDFINDLPDPGSIATYNVDKARLAEATGSSRNKVQHDTVVFRGSHEIEMFVQNGEPFDLTFMMQEINRHSGSDDVQFTVFRDDSIVSRAEYRDDGNRKNNGVASGIRPFRIQLPNATPGVYRIVLATKDDDPFIRAIVSRSKEMFFRGTLYLAGSSEYRALGNDENGSMTVYVKGTTLTASTAHENSLQTVRVGSKKITIANRHAPYTVKLPNPDRFEKITVPIADLRLETDGVFALSPDRWFSSLAGATTIKDFNKIDRFDYILAKGIINPKKSGQYAVTRKSIDLRSGSRTVRFAVSIDPVREGNTERINIKKVRVTLRGDSPITGKTIQWPGVLTLVNKLLSSVSM